MALDSLTIIERTLLANQFKILSFLDAANSQRHLVDMEVFENGYTGLYSEALQHIDPNETSRAICKETHDILSMYRVISPAIARLTPAEAATLDLDSIRFDGFDANNDEHYHFATFMIERKNLYAEHAGHDINSHSMASMTRYIKMLPVFNDIFSHRHIHDLGVNELQELIEAVGN
jgi:uncharacterized protein YfbU (UPF0304 family)